VTVTVMKGKSEEVAITLLQPAGANKTVIGVGAGIAGAGVIAGAVLLGVGLSKNGTISDLQGKIKKAGGCASATAAGDCADLRSAGAARSTLGSAGLWTLVGGGVVGIGTLIYAVAGGGSRSAQSGAAPLTLVPVVTAQGYGLTASGAF
jgi:hypothetical protein